MSFWRREIIDPALAGETCRQMEEQRAWIAREPANPKPWFQLAQYCRMEGRREEALGLRLEAVRLDSAFAEAHGALAEIYAVMEDYQSAWRHATLAEQAGDSRAADMLRRNGVG